MLDFRIGDAFLGEVAETDGSPALSATIRGTDDLERVDVVRDNRVIYSVDPVGPEYRLEFTDAEAPTGNTPSYYYVRCMQRDGNLAWSSPIWVKRTR